MINREKHHHIVLEGFTESEPFIPPSRGGSNISIPERNRRSQGAKLQNQLINVREAAIIAKDAQREAEMHEGIGIQVEFESFSEIELSFESLAKDHLGIELQNVKHQGNITSATVFVPDGKLEHFENQIAYYLEDKKNSIGRSRYNRRLIDAISQIRAATLRALWTDDKEFPISINKPIWWEVWVSSRGNGAKSAQEFRKLAEAQGIFVQRGDLIFPERIVLLVLASVEQMQQSMPILNCIAELRHPKETAEFIDSQTLLEQNEWLSDLFSRTQFVSNEGILPYVCLLDTGVTRGHPLITGALDQNDMHTVETGWGVDDSKGHGTQMAGLSLFGNMTDLLTGNDTIEIKHRLESVKLLDFENSTGTDPEHHGYLTEQAISRPEIVAPVRARVFSLPVTAKDDRDMGRPSAWSAALDKLTSDADNDGQTPRLIAVAAGNVTEMEAWKEYPNSNQSDGIHDPAQAWNVLTVGACTDLVRVTGPNTKDYKPIADKGGLSPFSTTSQVWQERWPLKPDVLLEGGNAAKDSLGAVSMPSLSLLTTYHRLGDRIFTTANATSAATALASSIAAQVMAEYPNLWPETIRALIVHSAEWSHAMKQSYLPSTNPNKGDYIRLLRGCGFGKPNLESALWSVADSLTMVKQDSLLPFKKESGKEPSLNKMNLHRLPWPTEILQDLGKTKVEMRVTLSYFIEPNPSMRGNSRYTYQSHGLRFDVKRPDETVNGFRRRMNRAAREESAESSDSSEDKRWLIGTNGRHRGSLHADIWKGTAFNLAKIGCIAVYPTTGWWKTRKALEQYDRTARYALVVSIKAPGVDVDLYTEVAGQMPVAIESEI